MRSPLLALLSTALLCFCSQPFRAATRRQKPKSVFVADIPYKQGDALTDTKRAAAS